ncbi:MAG: CPBP family intramembrane metalloprotease [Capsulimonadaceae bacterium]|nr:CPBP family intramembrane metalloprotease [Capsulimonadaceae bacterium]
MRGIELALVLAITIAPALYHSTYIAVYGTPISHAEPFYFAMAAFDAAASVALLAYVLHRSGRSLRDIGLRFTSSDFAHAALLAGAAWLGYELFAYVLQWGLYLFSGSFYTAGPKNVAFLAHLTGASLATAIFYAVCNPFNEELVVRAYVQTEVTYQTEKPLIAILVSVLLQISYHFYQGWFFAIADLPLFMVFAVYYQRTGRITPILLAHMVFDVGAVLAAR